MKKQYGIFEIDTKSRYYSEGLDSIRFLPDRYLHDSEEKAINWIPDDDGHYLIMPVYIKTENKEKDEEFNYKIKFLKELKDGLKNKK